MIRKAPFQLPAGFLAAFGYPYARRYVALFWECCGDEACYDDGQRYACGSCDNWMYLDFTRQPDVRAWLDANGINLGNSDEQARYWLVVDSQTNDVYAAPTGEAVRILRTQTIPTTE